MNLLVPVSWLREYLKTDVAAKSIAKYLTLCGPSVDRIEKKDSDYIFDTEVTTNRPDAFSIFGIAREANTILSSNSEKSQLIEPKGLNISLQPDISKKLHLDVLVTNSHLCPRFTAIILDNVKIQQSPAFIRNHLQKVGIRPINIIVDITNYLMIELGQPMHAFDYDKVKGAKMTLRPSKAGEHLTTLDGQPRKLPPGSIVIQDQSRLIDLCGIMGGENSQISRRTKRIVLFVQAYNPSTIRKTTQALAFRTDAAARFEKGVDLENILPSLSRAVYLAKKYAGAKIASELIDIYPQKQKSSKITLTFAKLNNYLGAEISPQKATQILKLLGFKVEAFQTHLTATPPSWRAKDTEEDVDLIEEIARIFGYHNIPATLQSGQIQKASDSDLKYAIELKKLLKDLGLTEVISYSIISKNLLKSSGISQEKAVELANPLTEEWQFMRTTQIPSLIQVISQNQFTKEDIKIFEVAKTYVKNSQDLPIQDLHLTICLSNSDFYQIKGFAENIFDFLKRQVIFVNMAKFDPIFEKMESANVKIQSEQIGKVGKVRQDVLEPFKIKSTVYALEINLSKILASKAHLAAYKPIPKYPPIIEDLSIIVDQKTPITEIISEIKHQSVLIAKVEAIDFFQAEKIGSQNKSITFRLTYQKSTGTPSQEEVDLERSKIITALEQKLKAQIRR